MTALPTTTTSDASTRVVSLESQYPAGLLGVPASDIRLTWQVVSDDAGARQVGYQLASGDAGGVLAPEEPVVGADSIGIPAPGALQPRERRSFAVRIATAGGMDGVERSAHRRGGDRRSPISRRG